MQKYVYQLEFDGKLVENAAHTYTDGQPQNIMPPAPSSGRTELCVNIVVAENR